MAEQQEDNEILEILEAADDQEQADGEQGEQEQLRVGAGKKICGKARRTLAPDNVKRSDIAAWDRNDKKTTWQTWKMQARRALKDSNSGNPRQLGTRRPSF